MRRLIPAVGILPALLLLLLMTACNSAAPGGEPSPGPSGNEPVYGGLFPNRFNTADPPSFDLHREATWNTYRPIALAYDNLLRYNPDGTDEIIPDLAEKWSYSADGKKLTLTL